MLSGDVKSVSEEFLKRIWVLFMDVCTVSLRLRVYLSVLALYGAANALYWKSSERQNSTHLTLLKHQNTKTSLYKLSKNHWVIAFFKNFGSVRKKLQYTVLLDHPVVMKVILWWNLSRDKSYLQGDPTRLYIVIFSDGPKIFEKCYNPVIFRELI